MLQCNYLCFSVNSTFEITNTDIVSLLFSLVRKDEPTSNNVICRRNEDSFREEMRAFRQSIYTGKGMAYMHTDYKFWWHLLFPTWVAHLEGRSERKSVLQYVTLKCLHLVYSFVQLHQHLITNSNFYGINFCYCTKTILNDCFFYVNMITA